MKYVATAAVGLCLIATIAAAPPLDDIGGFTPDAIFRIGNVNRDLAWIRPNGVGPAVRGELRQNPSPLPENALIQDGDLTYLLAIDDDPSAGKIFMSVFDPIGLPFGDHPIGDNPTRNGRGGESATPSEILTLIAGNDVARNPWNKGFVAPFGPDPQTEGMYTIDLPDIDRAATPATTPTDITHGAVPAPIPLPATLPLLAASLGGIGFAARRRRRR